MEEATLFIDPDRVSVVVDAEPLRIDLGRSVPVSLILNGLITNSMKHAFPDHRRGAITIELRGSDEWLELRVTDDGVGLPAHLSETCGLDGPTSRVGSVRIIGRYDGDHPISNSFVAWCQSRLTRRPLSNTS
jgi:signal transduction histidine kinase